MVANGSSVPIVAKMSPFVAGESWRVRQEAQAAGPSNRRSWVRIPYTLPNSFRENKTMQETLLYVAGATLAFGDFAVIGAVAAYKLWKRHRAA